MENQIKLTFSESKELLNEYGREVLERVLESAHSLTGEQVEDFCCEISNTYLSIDEAFDIIDNGLNVLSISNCLENFEGIFNTDNDFENLGYELIKNSYPDFDMSDLQHYFDFIEYGKDSLENLTQGDCGYYYYCN